MKVKSCIRSADKKIVEISTNQGRLWLFGIE